MRARRSAEPLARAGHFRCSFPCCVFPPPASARRELCVEPLVFRPRVAADDFGFVVCAAHAKAFGPAALRVKSRIGRERKSPSRTSHGLSLADLPSLRSRAAQLEAPLTSTFRPCVRSVRSAGARYRALGAVGRTRTPTPLDCPVLRMRRRPQRWRGGWFRGRRWSLDERLRLKGRRCSGGFRRVRRLLRAVRRQFWREPCQRRDP